MAQTSITSSVFLNKWPYYPSRCIQPYTSYVFFGYSRTKKNKQKIITPQIRLRIDVNKHFSRTFPQLQYTTPITR